MKIIFLDIDGVLNNYCLTEPFIRFDKSIATITKGTDGFEGLLGMDSEKVQLLNYIMEEIKDWKIVISSSWSYDFEKECRTQRAFKYFGFKYIDKIILKTSKELDGRGNQILQWVDTNNIKNFITIEDEPWDINGNHHSVTTKSRNRFIGRVFQPYCDIGLTKDLSDKIIKFCNSL